MSLARSVGPPDVSAPSNRVCVNGELGASSLVPVDRPDSRGGVGSLSLPPESVFALRDGVPGPAAPAAGAMLPVVLFKWELSFYVEETASLARRGTELGAGAPTHATTALQTDCQRNTLVVRPQVVLFHCTDSKLGVRETRIRTISLASTRVPTIRTRTLRPFTRRSVGDVNSGGFASG